MNANLGEPPAQGYCRGKLARENYTRMLKKEPMIPYPESKHVPHTKEQRRLRNRARRVRQGRLSHQHDSEVKR